MADDSNEERPPASGGRRQPTITDVAALTGLSKATVSRALNDRDRVSAATRARVMATLEEIGYIRNHAATSLSTGRTGLLGLVVGANRNPVVLSAMQGALSAAGGHGIVVYVSETDDEHDAIYHKLLTSRAVDGVVHFFPRVADEATIRSLQLKGVPVVLVEPQQTIADVSTVWPDSFHDGYLSTAHLLEQGHTRIALCADTPGWGRQHRYLEGYRRALSDASIDVDPELVAEVGWTHAAGFGATARWLALDAPPTAACYCCDTAALGAMACVRDRGLRLPEDLAVVGYDDTEMGGWVVPPLTALRDRRKMLVAEAFRVLNAVLAGAATAPAEREIRSDLAIRASSATRRP